MQEMVLIYNITDKKRLLNIRKVMNAQRVSIKIIPRKDYCLPIFQLLAGKTSAGSEVYSGDELAAEMMVMAVSEGHLDKILENLRENGITIPFKAVVTAENGWWNSVQLFHELTREHEEMNGRYGK